MAWLLLSTGHGLWKRAGMEGVVAGLDYQAAGRLAVAEGGDVAAVLRLLRLAEPAAVSALLDRMKD